MTRERLPLTGGLHSSFCERIKGWKLNPIQVDVCGTWEHRTTNVAEPWQERERARFYSSGIAGGWGRDVVSCYQSHKSSWGYWAESGQKVALVWVQASRISTQKNSAWESSYSFLERRKLFTASVFSSCNGFLLRHSHLASARGAIHRWCQ